MARKTTVVRITGSQYGIKRAMRDFKQIKNRIVQADLDSIVLLWDKHDLVRKVCKDWGLKFKITIQDWDNEE